MSGFYQNWLKVQNPNMPNDIVPMESGGSQTPFYFGGSQVPTALKIYNTDLNLTGGGINNYSKISFKPEVKGKGVPSVLHHKYTNIHLPRQMGSLIKPM